MNGGARRDDGDDVNSLLNSIRTVAREDDAEIARFPVELAPPLSNETRARIADQIIAAQAQARAREPGAEGTDALALRRQARGQRPRRTFVFGGGAVLAFAAAAAFTMWMRPSGEGAALPAYSVTASGGVAELRGGKSNGVELDGTTTETQRLRPESELRIGCRPDTAIAGSVAVRAFFVQGTHVEEVKPVVQVAPTGAAELRLRGAELGGRYRGHGNLRVVVGRPDVVRTVDPRAALGGSGGEAAQGESGAKARYWLTVPVDLED